MRYVCIYRQGGSPEGEPDAVLDGHAAPDASVRSLLAGPHARSVRFGRRTGPEMKRACGDSLAQTEQELVLQHARYFKDKSEVFGDDIGNFRIGIKQNIDLLVKSSGVDQGEKNIYHQSRSSLVVVRFLAKKAMSYVRGTFGGVIRLFGQTGSRYIFPWGEQFLPARMNSAS